MSPLTATQKNLDNYTPLGYAKGRFIIVLSAKDSINRVKCIVSDHYMVMELCELG